MISQKQYERIQAKELKWWRDNNYNPQISWAHYNEHFVPYFEDFGIVADVGCGPYPYIFNPLVLYDAAWAIDPLIAEYQNLPRYKAAWEDRQLCCMDSTKFFQDNYLDAVFNLNVLDHVRDPLSMLIELHRVLRPGGRLFLMVDVGKKTDPMHPHTIDQAWLLKWFTYDFHVLHFKSEKSWKWANDVMYFVGDKKEDYCDKKKE